MEKTSMKKLLILGFVLVTCTMQHAVNAYAGWPFNRTPKIEGVVTDPATGKPIENVVVSAEWVKGMPSPGGTVGEVIACEAVVTDKDGKYVMPAKITFHILSTFDYMKVTVIHPLFNTQSKFFDKYQFKLIKNDGYSPQLVSLGGKPEVSQKEPPGMMFYGMDTVTFDLYIVQGNKIGFNFGKVFPDWDIVRNTPHV